MLEFHHRPESLEESFVKDFLNRIREEKIKRMEHVCSQTLERDEYAENVGFIRSLKQQEDLVLELMRMYFPQV